MQPIEIADARDPRIAAYRDIRERDLTGRQGLFVAEGEVVLRTLLSPASLCEPVSLLIAKPRLAGLGDALAHHPRLPVHVAEQAVLDTIAGFPLHRGLLGLGRKPAPIELGALLEGDDANGVILAACGIGNHDNMGGLFRAAAAFGARGVVLDGRCCDPFYRKAVRVSVGAVLRLPSARIDDPRTLLDAFDRAGFETLALTPSATEPVSRLPPGGRRVVLVGSEGPGLDSAVIERCRPIGIPMSNGFDSLNVAMAAGIVLHHLTRG